MQPICWWLLLVFFAIHGIYRWFAPEYVHHSINWMFCASLAVTQAQVAGLWVCFGRGRFLWRLLAWFALAYAESWYVVSYTGQFILYFLDVVALCTPSLVVMVVLLALGVRIVRGDGGEFVPPLRSRFQFSLRDILSWVTAIAVELSLYQMLRDSILFGSLAFRLSKPGFFWDVGISNVLPPVALWSFLGRGFPLLRPAVFLISVAVVHTTVVTIMPKCRDEFIFVLAMCQTIFYSLVRAAGYRVVWSRRARGSSSLIR